MQYNVSVIILKRLRLLYIIIILNYLFCTFNLWEYEGINIMSTNLVEL